MLGMQIKRGLKPTGWRVVGEDFMVLNQHYDVDQMWFPFMDRVVFPEHRPAPVVAYQKVRLERQKYVQITEEHRQLYIHDPSTSSQYVLPFIEGKKVSNSKYKKMKQFGMKTWDRTPEGELYTVSIRTEMPRNEITEWCNENFRRRYIFTGGHKLTLESVYDAILAKMKFS